jgi:hypothetical protein
MAPDSRRPTINGTRGGSTATVAGLGCGLALGEVHRLVDLNFTHRQIFRILEEDGHDSTRSTLAQGFVDLTTTVGTKHLAPLDRPHEVTKAMLPDIHL